MSTTVDATTIGRNGAAHDTTNKNGKVGTQLPPSTAGDSPGRMQAGRITKYVPFPQVNLPDRQWPSRVIAAPPIWCSVDLRDGNQALAVPMSIADKLEMFQTLVQIGFKQIEVGFPSASQIEFDFMRRLIDENLIPNDVTIQLLVQAREELIIRSFESIRGAQRAIVHLYNSTSTLQRRVVFGKSRDEIRDIAVQGTKWIKGLVPTIPECAVTLQYSPESFVSTELDFALEVCEAVMDVWQPTPDNKVILNLPSTVEVATPNVHADQIEWMCRHLTRRDSAIISLHTHNDRGTGIAATELGLLAGADRVEGTLFGNGERTGNVDIVTVALNMYTQGIDPLLDFSNITEIRDVYERTTGLEVPLRQPYGGDLVFTAFSGSHQDAIKKGMEQQDPEAGARWAVPYLPIDPKDVGRTYEAIIRINSQSGKGGVAYVMENEFGFVLPKAMRVEFGRIINQLADERGLEISNDEIYQAFARSYLDIEAPLKLESFHAATSADNGSVECSARLVQNGEVREIGATGNGPINAFAVALHNSGLSQFRLLSYAEHSLGEGEEARAVAYIEIKTAGGDTRFGAGIDTNIELASIKALLCAVNRALMAEPVAAG